MQERAVELYQMRYFEEVARYESISKAASGLHITQPALSKAIAKLEDELGVELFERRGKRLHLNDQGRYYQSVVRRILAEINDSADSLRRFSSGDEGCVRIAVFGTQDAPLACTAAFMQVNPGARVVLEGRRIRAGRSTVHEHDIVFYPMSDAFGELAGVSYGTCATRLAVPAGHALAGREKVALEEAADEWFVFKNMTDDMYERSLRLCIGHGFYPRVRAVTSSGAAFIDLVRAGLGIGFVDGWMGGERIPGMAMIDLEMGEPDQALCFSARPVAQLSPLALRFLQHAFDFFGIPADAASFDQFDGN